MILDERSYLIKPEHVRDYLDTYVADGMARRLPTASRPAAGVR